MGGISVNRGGGGGEAEKDVGEDGEGVERDAGEGDRGWKGMWAHIEVRVIYWVHYIGKIRFHCNSLEWISSLEKASNSEVDTMGRVVALYRYEGNRIANLLSKTPSYAEMGTVRDI